MDLGSIEIIMELDRRVRMATSQFRHSGVAETVSDPLLGHVFGEIELTVADIVLVGILSQVHVLLTGPTACGKTDLARLLCQGLFGEGGWYLLKLNPDLRAETFADINTQKFQEVSLREAVSPAPFLSLPCTILDECNRCPPALTNVLLGFLDGRIELMCGCEHDVGYSGGEGGHLGSRYHVSLATANEGREYVGTFALDPALARRFTLWVSLAHVRPTGHDLIDAVADRTGHVGLAPWPNAVEQLVKAGKALEEVPLDPLALLYAIYLCNVASCPHSPTGVHPEDASAQRCAQTECRVQKVADGFCPNVGGFPLGVVIFLKRAACALAGLRAARTVSAVAELCEQDDDKALAPLRAFAKAPRASGQALRDAVVEKYAAQLSVSARDVQALVPFAGLGGKVWLSEPYVTKQFAGSPWHALRHYARQTYANLESFFRQTQALFQDLGGGNGAFEKLKQRLEHAERFNDPAIRPTLEPLLDRYRSTARGPEEVAEEMQAAAVAREAVLPFFPGASP